MDAADDKRLVLKRAIHQQDREALALLHIQYYDEVRHYITYHVDFIEDAEDLAQDVFVELCNNKGHYDGRSDAQAYLFGIARNIIRRYNRRKWKFPKTISTNRSTGLDVDCGIQHSPDASGQISSQKMEELIEDLKARLSPKSYEALKLRHIEGLCPKVAAHKAECSLKAFYARLERAMKKLQKIRREIRQMQISSAPHMYAGDED